MLKGMKYFNYKLKNKHLIAPIGDIHLGNHNIDLDLLHYKVDKIKEIYADVILMGDLIENATKTSPGSGVYNQILSPSQQIEEVIKLFKPIKRQIVMGVTGNHCERASANSGIDIMQVIMDGLDCGDKYAGYTGICEYENSNQNYKLYAWHGAGGGSTVQGAIRPLYKQAEWIDADVMMIGHSHHLFNDTTVMRKVVDGKFIDYLKHFVITGSFLKWDNQYSEMKGYRPMLLGSPLITLNGKERKIEVDLEW
jgi:predicted phosphodiesterase